MLGPGELRQVGTESGGTLTLMPLPRNSAPNTSTSTSLRVSTQRGHCMLGQLPLVRVPRYGITGFLVPGEGAILQVCQHLAKGRIGDTIVQFLRVGDQVI